MDHETCLTCRYWVLNVTLLIVSLYLRICIVKTGKGSNCWSHQNQPSLFPICGETTCSEYWVSLSLTKEADHEGFIFFLFSKQCLNSRRKRADLFLVCYRSVETSAADLQTVYRSSTDYLRIVCRMSAEYLQNVFRMSAEMICNLCRRSADEGGINSKHNNRRTAPIKHLLFLS